LYSTLALLALSLSALNAADKKLTFTTKSPEAKSYLEQAYAKIDNQQIPEARELVSKALQADSNFAMAHYVAGSIAQSQETGKKHFEKAAALAKNASEPERLYIEGNTASRSNDHAKAVEIFTKLSRMVPGERRVFFNLAQAHFALKQYDETLSTLQNVNKLDANYIQGYNLRANAYMMKGDFAATRKSHYEALQRMSKDRNNVGNYFGLAVSFVYENLPDSALAVLDRGLEDFKVRSPQGVPVFVWNAKGRINLENGRYEEALKCYAMGYSLVPNSNLSADDKQLWLGRLHHGTGRTLSQIGKHAEAWAHADTIKMMIEAAGEKGKPYLPAYHYLAGYLKLENGEAAAAIEHLKQADQSDHFIKFLMVRAYEALGEKEQARALLEEIVNKPEPGLDRALVYNEAKNKLETYSAK
jgi:tetratricopeptide (TPR) repeat protein